MTHFIGLLRCTSVVIGFAFPIAATPPQPLRAGVFLDCDGNYSAKVLFDHPFASATGQAVSNSGFEAPSLNGQLVLTYGTGNLAGWSVNNIDLVASSFVRADSGTQSIDLNSILPGSIRQTLSTTHGQNVLLGFSYSFNYQSRAPAPVMMAQVLWNGVPIDTIQVASNSSPTWKRVSIPFGRDRK